MPVSKPRIGRTDRLGWSDERTSGIEKQRLKRHVSKKNGSGLSDRSRLKIIIYKSSADSWRQSSPQSLAPSVIVAACSASQIQAGHNPDSGH